MPKAASKKADNGSGKKKRGSKPKKDPNAPKRNLSAYMFYAQENREKVKAQHPNATFSDMGKILGENWKAMTDAQKK
ncbi:MAG: high mobility group box domain-containing protein, partial [Olpidium bornovanus]